MISPSCASKWFRSCASFASSVLSLRVVSARLEPATYPQTACARSNVETLGKSAGNPVKIVGKWKKYGENVRKLLENCCFHLFFTMENCKLTSKNDEWDHDLEKISWL